jgi:hypothetical protein
MRKRKRKSSKKPKLLALKTLARHYLPGTLLKVLAKEYKKYPGKSHTDAEHEFWIKVSRSTANLASGMEKWVGEWVDEEEEKAGK